MKSKRLLILLAPLTLGVNATTLPESVAPSISGQEVIPNAEPEIPQTTSDLPSVNTGISATPEQTVASQSEARAAAPTETLSTQEVSQPADIPLPETGNEADLVNRMFDRGDQDQTQVNEAVSDPATPTAVAQSTIPEAPTPPPPVPEYTAPTPVVSSTIPDAPTPPPAVPEYTAPTPVVSSTIPDAPTPPPPVPEYTAPTPVVSSTIPDAPTPPPPVPEYTKPMAVVSSTIPEAPTPPPPVPQYSSSTKVSRAAPLAFGANLLRYVRPDIVKGSLGQMSGVTNTEIAKENVSDFLVSQAQNKINEVKTQPSNLTKQDVQEIQSDIASINADVASIKENLNLLAVAIADKSGKIDPALVNVDDNTALSDGEFAVSEAMSEEVSNTKDPADPNEAAENRIEHSKSERAESFVAEKYKDSKESDKHAETSTSVSDEDKHVSASATKEKPVTEKSENLTSGTLTSGTTSKMEEARPENEKSGREVAAQSEVPSKTEIADKSIEKAGSSELSLILQELKKVNDKVKNLDDKVDNLKRDAEKIEKSTDDEIKKKNN